MRMESGRGQVARRAEKREDDDGPKKREQEA